MGSTPSSGGTVTIRTEDPRDPRLGRRPDAALDVVFEDEHGQRVDGRPERGGLLEDVDAVLLALDHPGDPADLTLHPGQAPDETRAILGIRMTEMIRFGAASRLAVGLGHGRPLSLWRHRSSSFIER